MKAKHLKIFASLICVLGLFLASCNTEASPDNSPNSGEEVSLPPTSESTVEDSQEDPNEAENAKAEDEMEDSPSQPALPPEIVEFTIAMDDGRELEARYYPGERNPAPTIVLMHWAGGDLHDWDEIAPWLQNRGLQSSSISRNRLSREAQGSEPWQEPSWFPEMPENASFAVVSFSFGGFGLSPEGTGIGIWAEEASAAIMAASQLEGVDSTNIVSVGASIGADGAVDGCYLFNRDARSGNCLGALSLSPGNYLTSEFSYAEAVSSLDALDASVWCLTAEGDGESFGTCQSASGEIYLAIFYAGNDHGMQLVRPELMPSEPDLGVNTLMILQDFLEVSFGNSLIE